MWQKRTTLTFWFNSVSAALLMLLLAACENKPAGTSKTGTATIKEKESEPNDTVAGFDTAAYIRQLEIVANGDTTGKWPVKGPYPKRGAILPFKRIVAYYGNLFSKQMGILGELPEEQMLARLQSEVRKWEKADTTTPVVPALHYIAVTAQNKPGKEGRYLLRMPFAQIDGIKNGQ